MKPTQSDVTPRRSRFAKLRLALVGVIAVVGGGLGSGCLTRPLCDKDCRPRTTNVFVATIEQKSVDKIDLLFMVDNSISMADKQKVMQAAVPDLVQRLVNPDCVDAVTGERTNDTPPGSTDPCPNGHVREFDPIGDIHVGIITSSLGGHGAALCEIDAVPIKQEQQNDHAHLIATRPRYGAAAASFPGAQAPQPEGFLDWNPKTRPGQPLQPFVDAFQAMTLASGEFGCGFEASLEAIYRFLVDPAPYTQVLTSPCTPGSNNQCATPTGVDADLLAQRGAFLRPDSLVAIILLSDENDCSIRDQQQYYWAARSNITLWTGSSVCATNPNDPCCYSCLTSPPTGCAPDPICTPPTGDPPNDDAKINLRCFAQKNRFGLDFLYPTQRYVNALTLGSICPSKPDLDPAGGCQGGEVANPLLSGSGNALPRDRSLIFFAGIIGVPWQDIKSTTRVLADGTTEPVPPGELRYMTAKELLDNNVWPNILGEAHPPMPPGAAVPPPPIPPLDQLMVESRDPRSGPGPIGLDPADQGTIQPLNSGENANPANGHEWKNAGRDDLQYACIFPLETPTDCALIDPNVDPQPGCDCLSTAPDDNNPLCQQGNNYGKMQYKAKAYPGLRHLQVLKDFGNNSIVASICAQNLTNKEAQNYGYRPAVDAIVDRLKEALTGKCLPRQLSPDDITGDIPCSVIEAVPRQADCNAPGRKVVGDLVREPAINRLKELDICGTAGAPPCETFTLCEVTRADDTCLQDVPYEGVPGWCYVDPDPPPQGQEIGAASLVKNCNPNERRILRFVDPLKQTPAPNSKVLIACFGADLGE